MTSIPRQAYSPAPAAAEGGDGSSDGLLRSIMNSVRSIERAVRMENVEVERALGISLAQLYVLQLLQQHPAASVNELADRTLTHQSSVSVVVRRLTERGLVEKRPSAEDGRRVEIALSDAGRELLARAPNPTQAALIKGLRMLDQSVLETLDDSLHSWLEAMGMREEAPPMFGEDEPKMALKPG